MNFTNPAATGIPGNSPVILAQSAVPVINPPSSASTSANGNFVLSAALPSATAYANCWIYFPANAVNGSQPAGVYYCRMSSTTAGQAFNVLLQPGQAPYIPASPAAFSGATPGWVANTSNSFILASVPVLGSQMGPNGILHYRATWSTTGLGSDSYQFGMAPTISGANTQFHNVATGANATLGSDYMTQNRGVLNLQVSMDSGIRPADFLLGTALNYSTVDTSVFNYFQMGAYVGAVGHFVALESYFIELIPG